MPNSVPSLRDRVQELGRLVKEPSDLDEKELPDLDRLIDDWYDSNIDVSEEQFTRRILNVFKNSTHNEVYDQIMESLPSEYKHVINAFVAEKTSATDAGKAITHEETSLEIFKAADPENQLHARTFAMKAAKPLELLRQYIAVRPKFILHLISNTKLIRVMKMMLCSKIGVVLSSKLRQSPITPKTSKKFKRSFVNLSRISVVFGFRDSVRNPIIS